MTKETATEHLLIHVTHTIFEFLREHPAETFNDDGRTEMWRAFVAFQVKQLERVK